MRDEISHAEREKVNEMNNPQLTLCEVVRWERGRFANDRRRVVYSVLASYRDSDGLEYRKRFVAATFEPEPPESGVLSELTALEYRQRKHPA